MLIGHNIIIEGFKQLAKDGNLSHAYVFFGHSMIGKCLFAKSFANYLERGDFKEDGILQDAIVVEADEKGTLGIERIRQLKNFLWHRPAVSLYRMAIIDNAELLTSEAQNALLKIAEEPPASSLLVFITSDLEILTPTLLSRLSKIYFPTVPEGQISTWLMKEFTLPKQSAEELAKQSFGKPGLALRLLNDKKLQAYLKSAETLLALRGERKREFIREILEDEEFNFKEFLDAMILKIAGSKDNFIFWHKLMELRNNAAYFNLNPKLQLDNLI